jgi:hypothetical protein
MTRFLYRLGGASAADPWRTLAAWVVAVALALDLAVAPPRISDDGATVLIDLRYDVPVTDESIFGDVTSLQEAAAPTVDEGYGVAFGGE